MGNLEKLSTADVSLVCRELGLRDWSQLTSANVTPEEAAIIQQQVGAEARQIPVEEFQKGLEVELEHGIRYPDANVTHNHPLMTGKIVLAHLKESLDYYTRLEVMELEGDMLKAHAGGDAPKLAVVYAKLITARARLAQSELAALTT
jgi:hypothetical protein